MNRNEARLSLEELGAYIDSELDDGQRARVEAHLARCPEDASRVATLRRLDHRLRAGAATLAEDEPPPRLIATVRAHRESWRRRWMAMAAAILLLVAAGGGAWWLERAADQSPDDVAAMLRDANAAYRVYTLEQPGPAERGDPAQLASWLSDRLGKRIWIPDLGRWGFRLAGDRLLATSSGPAAQLTYTDAAGRRIICLFKHRPVAADLELRLREEGGVVTAYGADDDLGYAMTGRIPRGELQAIAEAVYGDPAL